MPSVRLKNWQTAIKLIPARTKLVPIEGAGHGLLQKSNREELPDMVVEEFGTFFSHPFAKGGRKDGAP